MIHRDLASVFYAGCPASAESFTEEAVFSSKYGLGVFVRKAPVTVLCVLILGTLLYSVDLQVWFCDYGFVV